MITNPLFLNAVSFIIKQFLWKLFRWTFIFTLLHRSFHATIFSISQKCNERNLFLLCYFSDILYCDHCRKENRAFNIWCPRGEGSPGASRAEAGLVIACFICYQFSYFFPLKCFTFRRSFDVAGSWRSTFRVNTAFLILNVQSVKCISECIVSIWGYLNISLRITIAYRNYCYWSRCSNICSEFIYCSEVKDFFLLLFWCFMDNWFPSWYSWNFRTVTSWRTIVHPISEKNLAAYFWSSDSTSFFSHLHDI